MIVEGTSDQYYLSSIKNYLIGQGLIKPPHEMVFIPSGGVSGIKAVVPVITGKDEILPYVILDSDEPGESTAKSLRANLYKGSPDRVINVAEYVGYPKSEIEDLFPTDFLADVITKYLRGPEEDFSDLVKEHEPIVPQIEAYAGKYGLTLIQGWRVDVARLAKVRLLKNPDVIKADTSNVKSWEKLFNKLLE